MHLHVAQVAKRCYTEENNERKNLNKKQEYINDLFSILKKKLDNQFDHAYKRLDTKKYK